MLRFITDFADQGVVLPVALTLAVSLAAQRWWRAALGWSLAAGCVLGLMLAVKLGFAACGGWDSFEAVRSPSGHTAVAALVAGGLAGVLARGGRHRYIAPAACAFLAALAVGITRVALGEHSVGDVIAATPIGVVGALLAVRLMGVPPPGLRWWRIIVPAVLVAVFTHGTHLPVERVIREVAAETSPGPAFCRPQPRISQIQLKILLNIHPPG